MFRDTVLPLGAVAT